MSVSHHVNALPQAASKDDRSVFAFRALVLFLVLEYVRPPLLPELKLQMGIVLLMLVLWFRARSRPWSPILTAQVLFLIVCIQAIPFASNYYAAYEVSRAMFGHVGIAIAMSWLLDTPALFRKISWIWLLIMGYVAIYGILHGGSGPGAMLGDENDLALGCATAFPFAFYGFERLSGGRRWLCGVIGALLVIAIVISFSRGGFVALVVVAVYCWLASRHKLRGLLVVAVAAGLLVFAAPNEGRTGQSYLERVKSIFQTKEGTAEGRRFLWAAARNMWKDHPVLGVGGGNFTFLVGRYQPTDFDKPEYLEREWSGTVTHSIYFQVLSEHGTVGILLVAYIAWMTFKLLRRLRRVAISTPGLPADVRRDAELYGGALGGALTGYLAAGAFLSVAYYPYFWYFSAMAVALEAAVQHEVSKVTRDTA
jgi:putative inorganic carbon (HCO3(-)) transporter